MLYRGMQQSVWKQSLQNVFSSWSASCLQDNAFKRITCVCCCCWIYSMYHLIIKSQELTKFYWWFDGHRYSTRLNTSLPQLNVVDCFANSTEFNFFTSTVIDCLIWFLTKELDSKVDGYHELDKHQNRFPIGKVCLLERNTWKVCFDAPNMISLLTALLCIIIGQVTTLSSLKRRKGMKKTRER